MPPVKRSNLYQCSSEVDVVCIGYDHVVKVAQFFGKLVGLPTTSAK